MSDNTPRLSSEFSRDARCCLLAVALSLILNTCKRRGPVVGRSSVWETNLTTWASRCTVTVEGIEQSLQDHANLDLGSP